jgi:hypothetical protein
MFTRKLRAAALMAGAVLAGAVGVLAPGSASAVTATRTATAAAAAPAVAVRSGWFGLEPGGDWCLDSNLAGSAYLLPCQVPGNKFQDWNWTEWKVGTPQQGYAYYYSIQDQATGRCLDSNAAGDVYTNPCQAPGNAFQDWSWGAGVGPTTTPASTFTDVATSRPLWGYIGDTEVSTFDQPAENNWVLIQ